MGQSKIKEIKGFYVHTDGGIYEVMELVSNSYDCSQMVLYRHVWPYTTSTWVRPVTEWHSRFTRLSEVEAILMCSRNKEQGSYEVSRARAARKQLNSNF